MKIKVLTKLNADDNLKSSAKINNPNIPVASDFDDIIMSLNASTNEITEPIKHPYLSKKVPPMETVPPIDNSLKEKADEYLKMAEAEEQQKAEIEREEALIEHHEKIKIKAKNLENKLKVIDPEYAEIAAENEEEAFEAVKQKKKNSIPWRNYMVYLILLTALTACFTFSKYISNVTGNSDAVVAKFDVRVVSNDGLLVNSGTTPIVFDGYLHTDYLSGQNEDRVCRFNVTNSSEVAIDLQCEVSGNNYHHVEITPLSKALTSGESTVVMVIISPSDECNNDDLVITFSSTQKD